MLDAFESLLDGRRKGGPRGGTVAADPLGLTTGGWNAALADIGQAAGIRTSDAAEALAATGGVTEIAEGAGAGPGRRAAAPAAPLRPGAGRAVDGGRPPAAGQPDVLVARLDPSGLAPGDYALEVTIAGTGERLSAPFRVGG